MCIGGANDHTNKTRPHTSSLGTSSYPNSHDAPNGCLFFFTQRVNIEPINLWQLHYALRFIYDRYAYISWMRLSSVSVVWFQVTTAFVCHEGTRYYNCKGAYPAQGNGEYFSQTKMENHIVSVLTIPHQP